MNVKEPVYKSIFGSSWDALPPVFKKHYANKPYSDDVYICDGVLDTVMCRGPFKIFAPFLIFFKQVPAFNERNVRCTVRFESAQDKDTVAFNRTFYFKERPYVFYSSMRKISTDCVGEVMRFGFVWRMHHYWNGTKIVLRHRGYGLSIFGFILPLPLTWLFGAGYAEETAVDDDTFNMMTHVTHPIWGKIYEYKGQFKMRNSSS